MTKIRLFKCTLVHVRKKHKYVLRGRELRGKEKQRTMRRLFG